MGKGSYLASTSTNEREMFNHVNKAEMLLLQKSLLLASSKEKESVLVVANREGRRRFSPSMVQSKMTVPRSYSK